MLLNYLTVDQLLLYSMWSPSMLCLLNFYTKSDNSSRNSNNNNKINNNNDRSNRKPTFIVVRPCCNFSFFKLLSWVRPLITRECVSTVFTVMARKSGNTQTLVICVCKTGLAGCVVLARFLCTSILQRKEQKQPFQQWHGNDT